MKLEKFAFCLFAFIPLLSACVSLRTLNDHPIQPGTIDNRQLQTRIFKTEDEKMLLSAGIAVLQDLGYTIENTEKSLGLVSASKRADAKDSSQIALAVIVSILVDEPIVIDKEQKIKVSMVTKPSKLDSGGYLMRVTFQRYVWNNEGKLSSLETLRYPALYQEFFDKLSKSVFLEAHQL